MNDFKSQLKVLVHQKRIAMQNLSKFGDVSSLEELMSDDKHVSSLNLSKNSCQVSQFLKARRTLTIIQKAIDMMIDDYVDDVEVDDSQFCMEMMK